MNVQNVNKEIMITIKIQNDEGKWKKRDISVPIGLVISELGSSSTWIRSNGQPIDTNKSFEDNNILNGEAIELISG